MSALVKIDHLIDPALSDLIKDVMEKLPLILKALLKEKVSVSNLMRAQNAILGFLVQHSEDPEWLLSLCGATDGWENAGLMLEISGETDHEYLRRSYLDAETANRVLHGGVTLQDLIEGNPQALLAPLFWGVKPRLS